MKLFISYRSLDSAKVDAIVSRLASLRNEDTASLYIPWQDKTGIPGAKDWWEAIVDAIIDCDVFVFHISQEALKSDVCRAELSYARKRNRPIIPVVLEGEFFMNQNTGKYEITYWTEIPKELNDLRAQFLFYDGASFFERFDRAVAEFAREPQKWRDIPASRPGDPREGSETAHDGIMLYDEACDYAGRMEFTTAEKLFQKLMNRNDPDFGVVAFEWIELLRQYERLLALDAKASTRFRLRPAWDEYEKLFPKDFLEGIFDPKGFGQRFAPATSSSVLHHTSAQSAALKPPSGNTSPNIADHMNSYFTKKRTGPQIPVLNLIPPPFSWVTVLEGQVTLEEGGYVASRQRFDISSFEIAKYPITNAQYAKFIEAGGYLERRWWTAKGWEVRQKGNWVEPRFWKDKDWNVPDYPVVGVSWYESIAFCLWLGHTTNEIIMLPTEQQWQRAAQGDLDLKYPWGNEWDASRCNNGKTGLGRMTAVQQYEGKGDSPYGVVDMVGNILEWTVTSHKDGTSDINKEGQYRVLKGGSWLSMNSSNFRSDDRLWYEPSYTNNYTGFRLVRNVFTETIAL